MVNIKDKIVDKIPDKLKHSKKAPPSHITNDTIAVHREKILAGGRKFKYPLQYSKHKILINVIIITIVAIIALGVWLWAMLYRVQATSDFFYIATKVLPLPVANVDGENVSYNDYLRNIRSVMFFNEQCRKGVLKQCEVSDYTTVDGQRSLSYAKRLELNKAEQVAYAKKIARAKNLSVSDKEVEVELQKSFEIDKNSAIDLADYERDVLRRYFGWTIDDYRAELHNQLLERKATFAVDTAAKTKIEQIEQRLKKGDDFAAVARETSDDAATRENGGGTSAQSGDADTNGLIAAARSLKNGAISGVIQGVDSYYIVKLESKTDDKTNFSLIKVELKQFAADFVKLREQGKIQEFIDLPKQDDFAKR